MSSNKHFPKNIGIVFIEDRQRRKSSEPFRGFKKRLFSMRLRTKSIPLRYLERLFPLQNLNFDQEACAYLLTQMNAIQDVFIINIMPFSFTKDNSDPNYRLPASCQDLFKWLDNLATAPRDKIVNPKIDYWVGITSRPIHDNWFFDYVPTKSGNIISIITSDVWEKLHSPPSVFEYIAVSVLICGLHALGFDITKKEFFNAHHRTRGCIFDFTPLKPDARIHVSNPHLCYYCRQDLMRLEDTLKQKGTTVNLSIKVKKIINREWMGDLDKKDSPVYMLKKNYGYDVNRNSGFYKGWRETMLDNIKDNTMGWIVGLLTTILATIITAIITLKQ